MFDILGDIIKMINKIGEIAKDMKEFGIGLMYIAKFFIWIIYIIGITLKPLLPILTHLPLLVTIPLVAIILYFLNEFIKKLGFIILIAAGILIFFVMSVPIVKYIGLGMASGGILILWNPLPKFKSNTDKKFTPLN